VSKRLALSEEAESRTHWGLGSGHVMLAKDHFVILNDQHLYWVMKKCKRSFNHARPHRGIERRIPRRLEQ
jgi:hypothetical protein